MTASDRITKYINGLSDWRGEMLARLRNLISHASGKLVEDWKWNTPIWSHNGNVLSIGAFRDHVKVNFFKGASLPDPHRLFNAGLEAKASRAIDIHEGERIQEAALQDLVRAAIALNSGKSKTKKPTNREQG